MEIKIGDEVCCDCCWYGNVVGIEETIEGKYYLVDPGNGNITKLWFVRVEKKPSRAVSMEILSR